MHCEPHVTYRHADKTVAFIKAKDACTAHVVLLLLCTDGHRQSGKKNDNVFIMLLRLLFDMVLHLQTFVAPMRTR